ncbi:MAG: hypothetical protein MR241_07195, partial [Firmicutes bacterium]|nr:hypothetical protein [Candidatus Colimorpha enterica]
LPVLSPASVGEQCLTISSSDITYPSFSALHAHDESIVSQDFSFVVPCLFLKSFLCRIMIFNRDFTTAPVPVRFSFSGERKTGKKKELQWGCPLDPRCAGETPQPHEEAVGRMGYRPHNADRSECTF